MPAVVELTVTTRPRRSRPSLTIHETTRPPETTQRQGIPLTAPLRTLQDLRATRPRQERERAITEALLQRLVTQAEAEALSTTRPAPTRSELERTTLTLTDNAGLPRPQVNQPLGPYLIDFLWPDEQVVAETDGYAAHGHRDAFEADRARDAALHAAGYAVLRFTWRQLTEEPLRVVATAARVLTRR